MDKLVRLWQLGKVNYTVGLHVQQHLTNLHRIDSSPANAILLLEHQPVFTIGIRTKDYTLEDEERLKRTGAEFHKTNRGGLITFHGPGQLIAYPILNLKCFKPSMRWYVCHLEQVIIDVCQQLGLKATTSPHTGVWIGDNKVCAIGVHGSRFITTHGLALNCNTDLEWYKHIIPCGIEDKGVTSLSRELGRVTTISDVIPIFLDSFSSIFDCTYTNVPKNEIDAVLCENKVFS